MFISGVFISCKTVGVDVTNDDEGVQGDQGEANQDGRQEHFSRVLGLSVSRKLERPVCQEVAWETWCRSEEQSTTESHPVQQNISIHLLVTS